MGSIMCLWTRVPVSDDCIKQAGIHGVIDFRVPYCTAYCSIA